ncbi:hypothetical protein [Fusobacterium sp. PH5-44]|uniref:hypothetical protein n=1 Tax=unclassified Fusobacterium TaxID=2648384 RepID=UPI003D213EDD
MQTFIMNNFLFIFIGVSIFFVVILVMTKINNAKKRNELEKNQNLVKITFDEDAFLVRPIDSGYTPGFTIYDVNNSKPTIADHTLFVNAGENIIGISYCAFSKGLTNDSYTSYDKINIKINAKLGYEYQISFNYSEKKYDIKEINK